MTSNRPYLLRALYDWITDNQLTPLVLINARNDEVKVPKDFIEDGKVVLNISPQAVRHLSINKLYVQFTACFSGTPTDIFAPMRAVMAIYASENGQGMIFQDDNNEQQSNSPKGSGKPKLTIIK